MCGLVGVEGIPQAATYVHMGLVGVVHRGQSSTGISSLFDGHVHVTRRFGPATRAFDHIDLVKAVPGEIAIGHVRYPTAGTRVPNEEDIQPIFLRMHGQRVAIAHNGNLTNDRELRQEIERHGCGTRSTSDTEIILHLLSLAKAEEPERSFSDLLAQRVLPRLQGAFSLLFLTEDGLIAVTDPHNMRPLCFGRLQGGYVFASEDSALEFLEAEEIQTIEGGTIMRVHEGTIRECRTYANAPFRRQCSMEAVYFASPISRVFGASVYATRTAFGRALAEENPDDRTIADVVVPIPDSANYFAEALAEQLGLPLHRAIVRSTAAGRSFIAAKEGRGDLLKLKHRVIRELIEGQRVILVDDSIVRGDTLLRVVGAIRACNPASIHVRSGSPRMIAPCRYGIDTATTEELIANHMNDDELARHIGADSVRYLSIPGYRKALGDRKGERYCTSCFTGKHPFDHAPA